MIRCVHRSWIWFFWVICLSVFLSMGTVGCVQNKTRLNALSHPMLMAGHHDTPSATLMAQSSSTTEDDEFLDEDLDFLDEEEDEEASSRVAVPDPLEPFNRAMYHFNDKFYFYLFKPVATVYRDILPVRIRRGVRNFFTNLTTPARFVNNLLQGKDQAAADELGRFLANSTIGVLGFGDPARHFLDLPQPPPEDLGQTLGSYGIGDGIYLVLPILGPSTLRDAVGRVGDYFLNPVTYVEEVEIALGATVTDKVNDGSFSIGEYEAIKDAAISPYDAIRDGYIQLRQKRISE